MQNVLLFDRNFTYLLSIIFPHNDFFNQLFSFLSLRGFSIFIWILVIISALVFEERKNPGISKRDKKFFVIFIFTFLIAAVFSTYVFKPIISRPRPLVNAEFFTQNANSCPRDFSFPSGHATTAFAAASILSAFNKKRKWLYYTTALLISYSRIFLFCHYLLDIVAGAVLGYLIGKTILLLSDRYTFPFRRKNQ